VADGLAGVAEALSERIGAVVGPLAPFGDGHSGFTYRAGPYVLRLSPPGAPPVGPADVGRQGRIMAALGRAGLPVPKVVDYDAEPVLAGRAFVLMEMVAGTGWEVAAASGGPHRSIAEAAVDVLHRFRALPVAYTGLEGEAPTSPSAEIARWMPLLERSPETMHEPGRSLAAALEAALPPPVASTLVHGDFHYGNLLFAPGRTEVVAVVDWEIAGLGPPLLDLGCLVVASLRRRYGPEPNPTGSVDIGIDELVALYGATDGEAAWYIGLSCLKYAAILGYNLGLHRKGRRVDPLYEELSATMHGLIGDGLAAAAEREVHA
jgi:aminoglycoside phosphotransferase (APT) family kinase protein